MVYTEAVKKGIVSHIGDNVISVLSAVIHGSKMNPKLTNRENIYQAFLTYRVLSADRIMKITNIPESSVHKQLKILEKKGLIRRKKRLHLGNRLGAKTQIYELTR